LCPLSGGRWLMKVQQLKGQRKGTTLENLPKLKPNQGNRPEIFSIKKEKKKRNQPKRARTGQARDFGKEKKR